jgi:hypothetical protein
MEYSLKHIMEVNLSINSNECVILNQGGKQSIKLEGHVFNTQTEYALDEVLINIKLDPKDAMRHEHIIKSAVEHLNSLDEKELKTREEDKQRFENYYKT